MKLIIDIPERYYEFCRECVINRTDTVDQMFIAKGTPYEERSQLSDEQIEKITDLLETEWGYDGIREDVLRILREADKTKKKRCVDCQNFELSEPRTMIGCCRMLRSLITAECSACENFKEERNNDERRSN